MILRECLFHVFVSVNLYVQHSFFLLGLEEDHVLIDPDSSILLDFYLGPDGHALK